MYQDNQIHLSPKVCKIVHIMGFWYSRRCFSNCRGWKIRKPSPETYKNSSFYFFFSETSSGNKLCISPGLWMDRTYRLSTHAHAHTQRHKHTYRDRNIYIIHISHVNIYWNGFKAEIQLVQEWKVQESSECSVHEAECFSQS